MCEVLTDSEPTAKKNHKCVWCGEMILKGETYHRQTGIFEGEPYTNKMHAERHGAMCELRKLDRFAVEDGFEPYSFGRGSYEDKFDAPPWMPQAAKAARGDTLPTGNSAS